MISPHFHWIQSILFGTAMFVAGFAGIGSRCALAQPIRGLTPQSPTIQTAIQKGRTYLEKQGESENRVGGKALIAMAVLKSGADSSHPLIRSAVAAIRKCIAPDGTVTMDNSIYSAGIAAMLLAELDDYEGSGGTYRQELLRLYQFLQSKQQPIGSWSYDGNPSGDMSMTQYGVMAFWAFVHSDIPVAPQSVDRSARWLLLVQDENGTYGYHTTVSADFQQISRSGIKPSTTAAGMASVYVCRELFGFNGKYPLTVDQLTNIPPVFRLVESQNSSGQNAAIKTPLKEGMFNPVQIKGDNWLRAQFSPIKKETEYLYYYLYAIERYWGFRELAEGKIETSPAWYNTAGYFLIQDQNTSGSWSNGDGCGEAVNTAYSMLVLLRSTRMSIAKEKGITLDTFGGGRMAGGRGLPTDSEEVRVKNGQVVSAVTASDLQGLATVVEKWNQITESPTAPLTTLTEMASWLAQPDVPQRRQRVTAMGTSMDIRFVPALIYALTDPAPEVAEAAFQSLHHLTRSPVVSPSPFDETNEKERAKKIEQTVNDWKEWYRRFQSDAFDIQKNVNTKIY